VLGKIYPQAGVIALLLYLVTLYRIPHSLVEVGVFAFLSASAYLVLFYISGIEDRERKSLVATGTSVLGEFRQGIANYKIS